MDAIHLKVVNLLLRCLILNGFYDSRCGIPPKEHFVAGLKAASGNPLCAVSPGCPGEAFGGYGFGHRINLMVDVAGAEAEHSQPQSAHILIAGLVVGASFGCVMVAAIYLHYHVTLPAVEIGDVRPDGVLPPELYTRLFPAQALPQATLGLTHIAPQLTPPGQAFWRGPAPVAFSSKRARPEPCQNPVVSRKPQRAVTSCMSYAHHPALVPALEGFDHRVRLAVVSQDELTFGHLLDGDYLRFRRAFL